MSDLLHHKLEALLFSEGGSMTKKRLAQLLGVDQGKLKEAAAALKAEHAESALSLVESESEYALAVAAPYADTVRTAFESEYERDIGEAGLEVLAIILYRGPSTRAQIDYIRGVNTASTIRTLASRGLIERTPNPKDAREYLYKPTVELLAHLGVSGSEELPDYAKIASELATFEEESQKTSEPFEDHAGDEPRAEPDGGESDTAAGAR